MGRERRLPPLAIDAMARDVADTLSRHVEGRDIENPGTWLHVAEALGVEVLPWPRRTHRRGCYVGIQDGDDVAGTIFLNPKGADIAVSRALVHELSHHITARWQPSLLPDFPAVHGYDDDPRNVHHRIARRVERSFLP